MERAEWLNTMRAQAEALYDHLAPVYWVRFGLQVDPTHRQFIDKFLGRLGAHSTILDAGCGAGLYDGLLLDAGHEVLGIDQSGRMLARAREHYPQERFPRLRYAKIGLQEIEFQAQFDGVICMDAMEHVSPEDWPDILARFHQALRPAGVLYVTVEVPDWEEVREAYERATALGLPVVLGEVVDKLDAACGQVLTLEGQEITGELADPAVYHYHPSLEQVRAWLDRAGLAIEEEGTGDIYAHFLATKSA
jgi:2-polyprenyl-3-methyl-5-hydroxy-6-metoxy-1,4-benzoquinol methylase